MEEKSEKKTRQFLTQEVEGMFLHLKAKSPCFSGSRLDSNMRDCSRLKALLRLSRLSRPSPRHPRWPKGCRSPASDEKLLKYM